MSSNFWDTLYIMLSPIWINQTITLGPYSWFLALLNTILPGILHRKLIELFVDVSLCIWLWNFLLERLLFVKMASSVSRTISLNTGPPQGCVLSSMLFSLMTHDCAFKFPEKSLVVKFADNTSVAGLIHNCDERAYRDQVQESVEWCKSKNLELNVSKTNKIINDFRTTAKMRNQHSSVMIRPLKLSTLSNFWVFILVMDCRGVNT